jgi:6-phosphogluconolactonase
MCIVLTQRQENCNMLVRLVVSKSFFVAVSPTQEMVYSVGETDGDGTVNSFRFDRKQGVLSYLNSQSAGGRGSCHVTTDRTGKWVMVGNYGGGSLSILL